MTEKIDDKMAKNMEDVFDIEVSTTPENGCTTKKDQLTDPAGPSQEEIAKAEAEADAKEAAAKGETATTSKKDKKSSRRSKSSKGSKGSKSG